MIILLRKMIASFLRAQAVRCALGEFGASAQSASYVLKPLLTTAWPSALNLITAGPP